jgi:putative intracellular protease/amidase
VPAFFVSDAHSKERQFVMRKIALILTPGFADWEYAYIAGIGGPFYGMDVGFFAPTAGEIVSQGGLKTIISRSTDEIADWKPDVVVVVGGMGWDQDDAPNISDVLATQRRRGGVVAGICGGTLELARAGLLNDVGHTSNALAFLGDNADNYTGESHFVASSVAVGNDKIITAPGTAATSFTALVFQAAGLDDETVQQFRAMTAAEHSQSS